MYLFLDTEFVPASEGRAPRLLSIGLCSFGPAEFYGEPTPVGDTSLADGFLHEHVLPQLGGGLGTRGEAALVAADLATWLDALGDPVLQICYDYHLDFDLFEQLLRQASPPVRARICPTHVGYLLGDEDADQAAESSCAAFQAERGLLRHHALSDAYALRARFEQVHGQ